MRVMFVTWAWPSHLYAMVPLAWACRAAGHDVVVASQPGLREEIQRTGLPGVPTGEDVDAVHMVREYLGPAEVSGGNRGPRVVRMLLAHAESMVDELILHARRWEPDIVVFEPTALAGPIAAAAVGVPAVRQLYGVDLMYQARARLPQLLEPLAQRHGVSGVDPLGAATIDPVPPSLRQPGAGYHHHLPVRYVPYSGWEAGGWESGGWEVPSPELAAATSRPRICVSWGTTIFRLDPARFFATQAVSVLRHLDIELVAAVTPDQRPLLTPLAGDNVRIIHGVPLQLTLPSCDLLICHGGAGTVLTGLSAGLPQLLIPQLPDHAGHAARVRAAGAGVVLTSEEATPEQLTSQVLRVLRGTDHRAAARRLQQEMRQLPAPAAIVQELEYISHSAAQRVPHPADPRTAGGSRSR